jgi:putative oxygen-independent coproporphyrinogen III oxidase
VAARSPETPAGTAAAPGRTAWPRSLYVHVPFCLSICPYCDFVVQAGRVATESGGLLERFQAALLVELRLRSGGVGSGSGPRPVLDTIYLGGGTPSLLGPRRVAALLAAVDRELGVASGAEITIEVNPGPRDRGDLPGFVAAGVTRVSVGAQSLQPDELRRLGRRHAPSEVVETVRLARAAGAASVSLDLLYDVPGQTLRPWRATLDAALDLGPDHVSAYALTLDDPDAEGLTGPTGDHLPLRPGARRWRTRAAGEQDPDRAAAMYRLADERLEGAGLRWYEVSNWARPGHRSRHNLAYWRRQPYLALGPGAHGFDGRRRWWNAARLDGYLRALLPEDDAALVLPPGGHETVGARAALAERAILGLRLSDGLDARVADGLRRDPEIRRALAWGQEERLLGAHGGGLGLTMRGRLLADELFVRMV